MDLPTTPQGLDVTQGYFLAEFYWFDFRVFFLLLWLLNQSKITLFTLEFTYCWKYNCWINTFFHEY